MRAASPAPPASAPRNARGASVRLEGVRRTFGAVRAVDDVSLAIAPGEFFTLLGPSGSGKTTTLQLIAGFQQPTAGEIYLDDQCVTRLPPFQRGIGVVFQSYALFPHMTVFENIAFPLRVRKEARGQIARRVEEALEMVKLPGYGGRRIEQLSGGQQQRVAVARAIVFNPRLLLMDEPLGALDARLRKEMQAELKRLQARLGVTVVYVTHDQEEALVLSDRIAVVRAGRVEQVAPPEVMYERPATRFVAEFIGDANVLTGTVEDVAADRVVVAAGRCRLTVAATAAVARGQTVSLVVRPERLSIGEGKTTANVIKGRVVETFFTGDQTVVVVETDDGLRVTVKEANLGAETRRQPGDPLTVGWAPEQATLLSE